MCENMSQQTLGSSSSSKSVIVKAVSPAGLVVAGGGVEPVSRTYQYRKVMKPMLERKRRARINRCLDELKELMVTALQSEGENVSKLEKADILELTVRHLHKLRRQQRLAANPVIDADRFRAGFTHAADEVSRCLAQTAGVDIHLGTKLMSHLAYRLNDMDKVQPLSIQVPAAGYTPPSSPSVASSSSSSSMCGDLTVVTPATAVPTTATSAATSITTVSGNIRVTSLSRLQHYAMPLTPASSRSGHSNSPSPRPCDHHHQQQTVIGGSAGLLKMAASATGIPVGGGESVWRPW